MQGLTAVEVEGDDGLEDLYRMTILNYEHARRWRARLVPRPVSQAGDSFASSPNWCKISVQERGLYVLDGTDLMAAGVTDLAGINPLSLRLFNGGGLPLTPNRTAAQISPWMKECAILVNDGGDGRFDPEDYIVFYGTGTSGWLDYFRADTLVKYVENEFTANNIYWLTWNGSFTENPEPRRVELRNGEPLTPGAHTPQSFPARVHVEQNRQYDPSMMEPGTRWEKWFYATLSNPGTTGSTSYLYTFDTPYVQPELGCSLVVRLWAPCTRYSPYCSSNDHTARAVLNGQLVDEESWLGFNVRRDLTGTSFSAGARDSLIITLTKPRDALYLAWYELFYHRAFVADNSSFAFSSPDTGGIVKYWIEGVADTAGLMLFDVTDYFSPARIVDYRATWILYDYLVEFEDSLEAGRTRHYLLVNGSGMKSPADVALKQFTRFLRSSSNGADYVIIVHEALKSGVSSLESLRDGHLPGIEDPEAMSVTTQEIYDEFSWGLEDPCAIRDFLSYAYSNWGGIPRQPSYVLMAGDASYDFRDYYAYGQLNMVPTWEGMYDYSQTESQLVTDDFFVLLDGPADKLVDMCLGRITFRTLAEANSIIGGKILPYINSPGQGIWRNTSIFVADDHTICGTPESLGYDHTVQTELVATFDVARALDAHKVYLTEYPYEGCYKPTAKTALVSDFNKGALIVNYIGHGSWNQLAHEQVFQIRDVASLSNRGKLPLFFAGSCKVAKFDEPFEEGLGEALLRLGDAGAVASVAATGLVYSWSNYDFNSMYYKTLFPGGRMDSSVTLGLALQVTKNFLAASLYDTLNAKRYVLMGDPGLVLATPELEVAFDTTEVDTIRLGQVVTISGEVRENGAVAGWYNGTTDLLVSGSEIVRTPSISVTYRLPGRQMFRGSATVEQGEFEFSFVVPMDVSVLGPTGRVRGYSMDSRDGAGVIYPVVVETAISPPVDTVGPTIVLRFDNGALYVPSQSVLHVILSDEHGINTAGTDVNNSILLQIDKALQPVDVTSRFVYSPDSYQRGEIQYVLPPLAPGPHSVTLVAHDNLGNKGSAELQFQIVEAGVLAIKDAINYPNPFEDDTYLSFELTADAAATIKIYTVSGRLIRELCEARPVSRGNNQFRWDGRDSEGHSIANGVYLYVIEVKDSQGRKDSFIGRAALLK